VDPRRAGDIAPIMGGSRRDEGIALVEALTPWHLLLIVIAFVLLFGHRKLPDASRSVGRSLRIFTSELRELSAENDARPAPTGVQSESVPPVSPSAEELEAQARAADAEAAALRARARAHIAGRDTGR
jgi:sec-independent protein translocase protein TatA